MVAKKRDKIVLTLSWKMISIILVAVIIVGFVIVIGFGFGRKQGEVGEGSLEAGNQSGLFESLLNFFKGDVGIGVNVSGGIGGENGVAGGENGENEEPETGVDGEQICGNTCAQIYNQKPYPDCSCYIIDTDTDNDGVDDEVDDFPNDASETQDTDGDGVGDNSDEFPDDATEWEDTDGDSVGDNADYYPNDPDKTEPDCSDSDNGKNVHVKGTMGSQMTDCCTEEGGGVCLGGGVSDYVMEHYCNSSDKEDFDVIQCPTGEKCVAGQEICVPVSDLTCNDDDVADDLSLKGTCTDILGSHSDECANVDAVLQYSCNVDNICVHSGWNSCIGGMVCEDGECIPSIGDVGTIFTSKGTWTGAGIGGLSGANSKCASDASSAELSGTWKALICTSTQNSKDIIPDTIYMNIDGTIIANNKADLFDGSLDNGICCQADGTPSPNENDKMYTGCYATGLKTPWNCNDWTSTSSAFRGTVGHAGTNPDWMDEDWMEYLLSIAYCSNTDGIYCVRVS